MGVFFYIHSLPPEDDFQNIKVKISKPYRRIYLITQEAEANESLSSKSACSRERERERVKTARVAHRDISEQTKKSPNKQTSK